MAKRTTVRRRRRPKYKFYRVYVMYSHADALGGESLPEYIHEFLHKHGCEPRRMRPRDFDAAHYTRLVRLIEDHYQQCIQDDRLKEFPFAIELRSPIGSLERRWSRVRKWNYPPLEGDRELS